MKERKFDVGDTIAVEGQSGIGFFIIDEGEATISVKGEDLNTLGPGDYFGEVALIDDGARTATITAKSPLKCYGITSWEFKPLVEQNADLAWKMLQTMAKMLRASEQRVALAALRARQDHLLSAPGRRSARASRPRAAPRPRARRRPRSAPLPRR